MSSAPEQRVTAKNVTLENCDREQIQYSNAVQPHAVLLVIDKNSHVILQASANAHQLERGTARDLIGRPLQDIFDTEQYSRFAESAAKLKPAAAPRHLFSASVAGEVRDVFGHCIDGCMILELERQGPHVDLAQSQLYRELRSGIAQLNASTTVVEFLEEAVHVIAKCTGFERVMAYRFHPDGSGEVVAETVHKGLERYLGLHYPAADIPKPARRLFSLTWLRHLPDVSYQPIPIIPEINSASNDTVDLSYAFSRSVSAMYTEYLKNMGVKATLVLTLFKADKLWGLISCMHHSAPRHLNIEVRGICEMLAQTISLLMSAKEDAEFASYRAALSACLERLTNQLALRPSIVEALTTGDATLLDAIDACGAAILLDSEVTLLGRTPVKKDVERLADQIAIKVQNTWSSDMLTTDCELTERAATLISGVLATRIGHTETDLLLWFRPEYRETVSWAGDPSKPVVRGLGREARLNPNGSFDVWRSEVRARAKPWLDCEIDFASKLGRGILEVVIERARTFAKLNQDLSRSNRELEEFVYTASHDLKTPLRGIASYAQILQRSANARLDEPNRDRIENILKLTKRMDSVIEGLLRYSELGHASLTREDVDLNEVCQHVQEMLAVEIQRKGAELRIPRALPRVQCDVRWVEQILLNLIGNGLKYNDNERPWVEIGYQNRPGTTPARRVAPPVFYVRDNGIGIAQENTGAIFRLFHRLHSQDTFGGGTGLGLSIVARAVERHEGRLWLESEVGTGTTFFFTLSAETK
ncbi:MAG TPA: ATP-binding protein [Bryobacteraceae bacterium]|nr:ATP-binding protein [Bryobacteraceae bacterium]